MRDRFELFVHNFFLHPVAGLLWLFGLAAWGDAVHDFELFDHAEEREENELEERRRQLAKERAIQLALSNGEALFRDGLNVFAMTETGSRRHLVRAFSYETLWTDAWQKLNSEKREALAASLQMGDRAKDDDGYW